MQDAGPNPTRIADSKKAPLGRLLNIGGSCRMTRLRLALRVVAVATLSHCVRLDLLQVQILHES